MMRSLARGVVMLAVLTAWVGCGDDGSTKCEDGTCDATDQDTVVNPTIVSVNAGVDRVTVGQSIGNLTVTLDQAPTTDIVINLVVVVGTVAPSSVTVLAGSTTSSAFTYTAPGTPTTDTITATYGRSAVSANITVAPVAPPPLGLAGVSVGKVDSTHPAGETPTGSDAPGVVTLTAITTSDITVQLTLTDGNVGTLDSNTVVILAGTNSANFNFQTGSDPGTGTITATAAGLTPSSVSGTITVVAPLSPP